MAVALIIGIALIVAGGSLMVWALCAIAKQADADLYRHGHLSDEDMAA